MSVRTRSIVRHVKRRSRMYLINDILQRARQPATSNDIMYDVRLSFTQAKSYIATLVDIGCLEVVDLNGEIAYRITEKGFRYLEGFKEIKPILEKS